MLKEAPEGLGLATLPTIKDALDRKFGAGQWTYWEVETIFLELGIHMDALVSDKIQVIQCLLANPEIFYKDPAFMLHATEVINNEIADFDTVPMPTSLELGFAITQVGKVLSRAPGFLPGVYPTEFVTAIAFLLREEGYSEPVAPFDFVPAELLEKGQTTGDTANKAKALQDYIKHMETL